MSGNRKKAEAAAIALLNEISGQPTSGLIYKDKFSKMSDAEFERWIQRLKSGEETLIIQEPNFTKNGLDVKRNIAVARRLGVEMFQRLIYGATDEHPAYMSTARFLVCDMPFRRVSQTVQKKRSIPPHNRSIDALTGQPTGDSKGAKISYPELQILAAQGMENTLKEFMMVRGGDNKAFAAMNAMIESYGSATLETVERFAGGVTSVKTMSAFLTAMHLANNLADNGKGMRLNG